ncbi:MAG: pyridoxal 5'-phosphate synthase glutaminase subunit PdxT [Fidelibacterota bacterium]|nr:MAG: pyridoxal 5'-phosphate synthase glutaminase subunit PdxT [Candidatus Neomarinimicrobiota bacterium]
MVNTIGVLALQGDFTRHREMLVSLGCRARAVRYVSDLEDLAGLVIPGGESTTISKQLDRSHLREAVSSFARERPVMGTCAGLILMAREPSDNRVKSLNLLDVAITRNSWGRQVHSFTTPVKVQLNGRHDTVPAVFIRAPRIHEVGPEVEVLARIEDEPVLVRQFPHMGIAFHPELTNDTSIHRLFLEALPS